MPHNFVADGLKQRNCSRVSSSEVQYFTEKRPFCVFELPFGGLAATYNVHLRLIGKSVVDFLLVLIELFARCYC